MIKFHIIRFKALKNQTLTIIVLLVITINSGIYIQSEEIKMEYFLKKHLNIKSEARNSKLETNPNNKIQI